MNRLAAALTVLVMGVASSVQPDEQKEQTP